MLNPKSTTMLFTPRLIYFYAFLSTLGLVGLALYLQFGKGIEPCPLCVLQRIDMVLIGFLFLLGFTCRLKKCAHMLLAMVGVLFSMVGIFLAGRQVWIQHLPPTNSMDCGVSLQYMLHVLPIDEVIKKIFQGTAECSLINWSWGGFSLAEWSLLWFTLFTLVFLWQLLRKK